MGGNTGESTTNREITPPSGSSDWLDNSCIAWRGRIGISPITKRSIKTVTQNQRVLIFQSDLGVDLDECPPEEPPSVVVVAFSIAVWEDSIRYGREYGRIGGVRWVRLVIERAHFRYSRGADGPPPDSLQEMKHEGTVDGWITVEEISID